MMSEQYTMADELGDRGHVWQANANWPATGFLLSYGALPSIYLCKPENRISIASEASRRAEIVLASGEQKRFC